MEGKTNKQKIRLLQTIGVIIVVILVLRPFFFTTYEVEGESMMPTLLDGNKLFVNKMATLLGEIERFDIIVFRGKRDDYVKRVIALPGDKVKYEDDILYINDKVVEEPFLDEYKSRLIGGNLTGDFTLEEVTDEQVVPDGLIFVIGDNRLGSWDSRHFGFVEIKQVIGTVNVKYWPIEDID